ncbi:MAG: CPBP family intramembrane metalloprotease [Gemmatimonas sp.]|nr:CPBP family intramembrane metalloprotease [Gemmatimonas sp.]
MTVSGWLKSLTHRDGRIRPPWRIALYFLLFAFLTLVGQIVIIVLPRHPLEWGSLIVTTSAAIVAGWILISRLDGRPFGALGFPLHGRVRSEIALGLAIGAALLTGAVLLLLISGSAGFAADRGSPPGYVFFLLWTFVFFAIAAAWEEAVFRGYPFQALVEWVGPWPATIVASLLFAYLHAQNPNVTSLALANIFLAGVLLSIAYLKTRSLWFATAVHLGWNWSMATLFDFPVSGLIFDTPLYTGVPTGEDWWTGGAFGPEAGVAGTFVLVVGTVCLVRSRRLSEDPELERLGPIVDQRIQGGPF